MTFLHPIGLNNELRYNLKTVKYSKVSEKKYLLRLERNEKVNEAIASFVSKMGVKNASISGIGSIEDPTLAHYRVDTRKYSEKPFKGIFEVLSFLGNIAIFDDFPLVHTHISLSNEKMKGLGGHLVEAKVSATMEVVIDVFDTALTKSFNDEIGLKLWDLEKD